MHGAPVLGWLLAALTGAAGLYCLARVWRPATGAGCAGAAQRGAAGRESDAAEALMGLGMAAMALPLARHGGLPPTAWAAVFGGVGAWFAAGALRRSAARDRAHRLHHALGAGAMVYMALAMAAGGTAGPHGTGHSGMAGGPPLPLLTGLLLVYFGGYALWAGSGLLRSGGVAAASGGRTLLLAPGLARECRLVMGLGMFAMLLTG
ncbi:DUF5134 domain-containing protein [Peterkaempfera bronchialis]|uniref:DUF5134 domain-containing protein n=1 Tax=Peterkaempfera bronchialis TaxID=2126346 RepID=UPI003C2BB919